MKMLISQIPEEKKEKLSLQTGINLGVFNTKATVDRQPKTDGDYISSIETVCEELEKQGEIGTLEFPGEWVKDEIHVKYLRVNENPGLFIMVGEKHGRFHLLGGSSYHILGNQRPKDTNLGYSFFPYLAKALEECFSEKHDEYLRDHKKIFGKDVGADEIISGIKEKEWADTVYRLYNDSDEISFPVEFFAKYYAEGKSFYGPMCTISSPVYVSQK